jgi:hypothetical protein
MELGDKWSLDKKNALEKLKAEDFVTLFHNGEVYSIEHVTSVTKTIIRTRDNDWNRDTGYKRGGVTATTPTGTSYQRPVSIEVYSSSGSWCTRVSVFRTGRS